MCPLKITDTIQQALEVFGKTGTHRIPILHSGKITHIVTQSTVVAWLAKHAEFLGTLGSETIQTLSLGLKDVVSVKAEDLALDAFRLMNKHRVNAVAVLETDGTLMTTLSAKDIKVLDDDALFTKLYKSTIEFVSVARSHELDTTAPAMSSHLSTSFKEVILKLGASRRHRVWITNDKKELLGVISLKDVIVVLLEQLDKVERIMK
jgi:CBS-domain-containing membrane protein